MRRADRSTLSAVLPTLQAKIEAEHRLRELLRTQGLPQPNGVEYGYACVRFFFNDSKTCVVIDLDAVGDDRDAGNPNTDP